MMKFKYYWAKLFKKIRGSSIKLSSIHASSKVESGSNIYKVSMAKHSFCGYDCEISNCEIGAYVSIANNVTIGGGMHPIDWVGMSPVFYEGRDSVKKKFSKFERPDPLKTTIGSDVWIGNNVLIKQGVTVGHGAVIGMGSVVTKDVSDYSIVAGVPAKEIKKRFNENIIDDLLSMEWWNFEDAELEKYAKAIKNPKDFIEQYKKANS